MIQVRKNMLHMYDTLFSTICVLSCVPCTTSSFSLKFEIFFLGGNFNKNNDFQKCALYNYLYFNSTFFFVFFLYRFTFI